MNVKAYFNLSYGVYVLGCMDNGRPTGCIVNSAMQITNSPNTIAVSVNLDNYSNKVIEKERKFSISILPEDISQNVISTMGFKTGANTDKFDNIEYRIIDDLPIIEKSVGHFICKVIDEKQVLTHTVFIGEIIDCDILNNGRPMTYEYYHKVIKGNAPKNAPTYIPIDIKEVNEMPAVKYVCPVCGYVYDGETPFEELPDDYVCPICGEPKSAFVKK